MRKWARNIHVAIGLLTTPFLLMYAVSAIQMAHAQWFDLTRTTTKITVPVMPTEAPDGRALARVLMTRAGVSGEVSRIETIKTTRQIRIERPGATYEVTYDSAAGKANIIETKSDIFFLLNRLHHLAGINHHYFWLNVWGWVLGVTALLLIGLGATGIYLWFKMHGELAIGLALLTLSFGFSMVLLYLLRVT